MYSSSNRWLGFGQQSESLKPRIRNIRVNFNNKFSHKLVNVPRILAAPLFGCKLWKLFYGRGPRRTYPKICRGLVFVSQQDSEQTLNRLQFIVRRFWNRFHGAKWTLGFCWLRSFTLEIFSPEAEKSSRNFWTTLDTSFTWTSPSTTSTSGKISRCQRMFIKLNHEIIEAWLSEKHSGQIINVYIWIDPNWELT